MRQRVDCASTLFCFVPFRRRRPFLCALFPAAYAPFRSLSEPISPCRRGSLALFPQPLGSNSIPTFPTLNLSNHMKKLFIYFSFLLVAGLSWACEHVDIDKYLERGGAEETGNRVVFSISPYQMSDFDAVSGVQVRASRPVTELCSHIDLAVFDGGSKLRAVSQSSGDKDFGVVSTKIPEGTYRIVIIAHNCKGKATMASPREIKFPDNKVTDTFYYCEELKIGGEAKYDVMLKRAVAKFVLKVGDRVPAEVKQLQFAYTGGSSTFNAETGYGSVNSRQTEVRVVGAEARQAASRYEIFTFPHADGKKLKITITAQDGDKNAISSRVLEDVPVGVNKITTYSGNLFQSVEPSRGASFTLQADDAWSGEGFAGSY